MVILTSHRYRKDLKKCIQRGLDMRKLNKLVDSLLMDVSINVYPCHPLIGNYIGYFDCHVERDWLLIYRIEKDRLFLERTGTHSDLF